MSSLVIVESPAKSKTINKILGDDFKVTASIGHIKDLPKKELGVDIKNNFNPLYIVIPGKEGIITELKRASKKADNIYIATDPDREGEAIAYHISEEISQIVDDSKIYRVIFNEITNKTVKDAIKNPGKININKVDAQYARRVLDRIVGYALSPFLWKKIRTGLSAGRVQSIALRLIVDREREILSFNQEEYWTIQSIFEDNEIKFSANLFKYNDVPIINRDGKEGERFLITSSDIANKIIDEIKDKEFYLSEIERNLKKKNPYPPFITSTLQQDAARRLNFLTKKTMLIAQQLYEGIELGANEPVGLITYMRTDSFRVAKEAQEWAADLITKKFGKEYLPEKTPFYKSKSNSQESHEAIRPTYPDKIPEFIRNFLTKDQYNLYNLIWRRFISSQMASAQMEQTTLIIKLKESGIPIKGIEFRVSGTVIKFLGFMAAYTEGKEDTDEETILPQLKEGATLKHIELKPFQHFTQPSPRYNEGTLVKALEDKDIGRPSTYATIISTIQNRAYTEKQSGKYHPTELGLVVNDLLVEKFPDTINYSFTAQMEDNLDDIENAKIKWVKVIQDFFVPFKNNLQEAVKGKDKILPNDTTDEICEKCKSQMIVKWSRYGKFISCSNYPKCKNAKPLNASKINKEEDQQIVEGIKCEKCGSLMMIRIGKFGRFIACCKYPECKNTKPITTGIKCPKDNGDIIERKTKKGKVFWGCNNYPACDFATWNKPIDKKCSECGASFLVEKISKKKGTLISCLNKDCKYKEIH